MLVEISTSIIAGGIMGVSHYFKTNSKTNDAEKILKIANNCGLFTKEEKLRLYRRNYDKKFDFTEYVFKVPLGLGLEDFLLKKSKFVDGLNNRSRKMIELRDLKTLKFDKTLPKQLLDIFNNRIPLNKEIEIEYDGMLNIRVYNKGLTKYLPYTDELLKKVKGWEVPIGVTYKELINHDFEKSQMLVVAGMTRYGKTVFLKNTITTLISKQPENVKFTLIDLKGGLAFSRFMKCKQVEEVAKNQEETIKALESIHDKLLKRQKEFLNKGYEDIGEAGIKERHFIVIDEGAEISGFTDKVKRERCTHLIGEIARISAGLGYRMIFATQYPTADVFPRQVKANTSGSLCFKLKNSTQSMVVLDEKGAEELPVGLAGRAIYQSDRKVIVQSPYIKNDFIDNKIKPHITFKARKESQDEQEVTKTTASRRNMLVIEETRLS
ncbi:cell division protein FtsK [Bacillus sp. CH30_1T]|uniref:FtsK/SpoIIIE domain-containing protein n=1 Tax=Bacillus sp. CH30_1T TaxID=2604836 RepID=UPI0011EBF04A|nr:FtsK/SpoIIIE domain-containing protein [Bacillus sp. CH30_1T]KAA0565354.1 cell division protein FtsK [Bacillus sp. CH30_1T]